MSGLTILLPSGGRSSRYPNMRPKWMLTTPEGDLMLARALDCVKTNAVTRIVVGILREHDEKYSASRGILMALGEDTEIVLFDDVTRGPADTTYQMIKRCNVEGPILIKDSDSWFVIRENSEGNYVCVTDLRENPSISNVAAKSFVTVNDQNIVTRIREKTVISNFINAGGYAWADASEFCRCFDKIAEIDPDTEIFVSHVISKAVLDGEVFFATTVDEMLDAGTVNEWMKFREKFQTLFIDIDGVVVRNRGEYFPPYWTDEDEPIMENVSHLLKLQEAGAQLIFATARPETFREKVEGTLRDLGFRWHAVIMDCHHSRRIIINDFAPSNPFPSCEAVNIPRNSDRLAEFLPLKSKS